ncbi:MAG: ATP-binding protein [Planctomycetota bacterium]
MATRGKTTRSARRGVRLRPQDPFDLIRLLARSQSDPKKAVAELVQNSLDAGARRIEISWFNDHGRRAIRIWDDGEGIFPELGREEALRRIARTIGHSYKGNLSPAERREQMVLGKYGIGLIGFWSVGEIMEIRSRVGGGDAWCLRLVEEKASGEVYHARARRLQEEDTFTEITVHLVHDASMRLIRPPRLQAYLAAELRGQLLDRQAEIHIHDRVARGRSRKQFRVQAQPYLGVPLPVRRSLAVPGHEEARIELYLVAPEEERTGRVSLACGGSTVLDDLSVAHGFDLPRPPWSTGRLEGVVDFPDLDVAPGSRRGFVPNAAAAAFLAALEGLEREIEAQLAADDERRHDERQRSLAREIRRAFRPVLSRLREVELFDVRAGPDGRSERPEAGAAVGEGESGPSPAPAAEAGAEEETAPPEEAGDGLLFPPGPLARLRLVPARLRLAPGGRRTLRARAVDADGRTAAGEVRIAWRLEGAGELAAEGAQAAFVAADHEGRARITATAVQGRLVADAVAEVEVLEDLAGRERTAGIPEPQPIRAPSEPWRSRMRDGRWEYNEGHADYRTAAGSEASRLRYLIHLFAKEVVLRNFGRPIDAEILERMVQVLTHLGDRRGK